MVDQAVTLGGGSVTPRRHSFACCTVVVLVIGALGSAALLWRLRSTVAHTHTPSQGVQVEWTDSTDGSSTDDWELPEDAAGLTHACGRSVEAASLVSCLGVLQPHVVSQVLTRYNTEGFNQDSKGMTAALGPGNPFRNRSTIFDIVVDDVSGPGNIVGVHLISTNSTGTLYESFHHTRVVIEADGTEVMSSDVLDWCNMGPIGPRVFSMDEDKSPAQGCFVVLDLPFSVRARVFVLNATFNPLYFNVHVQRYPAEPVNTEESARWDAVASSVSFRPRSQESRLPVARHSQRASRGRAAFQAAQARLGRGEAPQRFSTVFVACSGMGVPDDVHQRTCARGAVMVDREAAAAAKLRRRLRVPKGKSVTMLAATTSCGGVIRSLHLVVHGAVEFDALDAVRLEAIWDGGDPQGRPQVSTSLATLTMIAPNDPDYFMRSLYVYSQPFRDGLELRIFLPAPFQSTLLVSLQNFNAFDVYAEAWAFVGERYPQGTRVGHLYIHDKPRFPLIPVVQGKPVEVLSASPADGLGHYVGFLGHAEQIERVPFEYRGERRREWSFAGKSQHEGDINIYVDGLQTPSYAGSGAEDFFLYGHGFRLEKGSLLRGVSEVRDRLNKRAFRRADTLHLSWRAFVLFPPSLAFRFHAGIRFDMDHGDGPLDWWNRANVTTEFAVIYYKGGFVETDGGGAVHGTPQPSQLSAGSWIECDNLTFAAAADGRMHSAEAHAYTAAASNERLHVTNARFYVHHYSAPHTYNGWMVKSSSSFVVFIPAHNDGIVLQRVYDASFPNQGARVFVNGAFAGIWFDPGGNSYFPAGHSQFVIAPKFTVGCTRLTLRFDNIGTTAVAATSIAPGCDASSVAAYRGLCAPNNTALHWIPEDDPRYTDRLVPAARSHWTELEYRILYIVPTPDSHGIPRAS